jgi:hypothetical protein
MEVQVAGAAVRKAGRQPHLRPIRATLWSKAGGQGKATAKDPNRARYDIRTFDLRSKCEWAKLEDAFDPSSQNTVWLETSLEDLQEDEPTKRDDDNSSVKLSDEDELAWYGGSYNVWKPADKSIGARPIGWAEMIQLLESVGLEEPTDGDTVNSSLLRAIPYVFTRGAFGTVRDVLSGLNKTTDDADEDTHEVSSDRWTVFPAVGFHPLTKNDTEAADERSGHPDRDQDGADAANDNSDPNRTVPAYTTIRTMVGVVGQVVITVRLRDVVCAAGPDAEQLGPTNEPKPLEVPRRFFPQSKVPRAREIAEAIGIHQAATVRAVANQVRDRLATSQVLAKRLRHSDITHDLERRKLRKSVVSASKEVDQLAEIVVQLDQRISRLLRRLGGKVAGAPKPATELVPPEVEKGYRHALDEVKSLHREHRRTSQALTDALSIYDQDKRESFQHIAAILASLVLIPTLFASLFGVNFNVPANEEQNGFWVFVGVIAAWIAEALVVLKRAHDQDWYLPKREYILFAVIALVIAIMIVVPCALLL